MNPEIKFRAWDGTKVTQPFELFQDWYDDFTPSKVQAVMRYTGLHDSKGVEIYEGDIVKAYVDDENGYAVTKVWYMAPQYLLANYTSGKLDGSFDMADWSAGEMVDDFEVIGNIYEHPYLLGGEKYTTMHYGEVK